MIEGCTDEEASNYIATIGDLQYDVNTDDGSCYYLGCMYQWAINYNPICNYR